MYCKAQSHNWQLQLNQTGLLVVSCSTGQRLQERSQLSLQTTISKSKPVLEMTAAGLDTRWETAAAMMAWSGIFQWHHNYVTIMLCRASSSGNTVFPWHMYVVAVLEKTQWKTKAPWISHHGQFPGQTNLEQRRQHLLSLILVSLRSLSVCLMFTLKII